MNFQLSGEVLRVLPVERGTTKNGYPFQKQTIVVRCFDKEQHVVALDLRGSRVDEYDYLKQGSRITAFFEIDSRSWEDSKGVERFHSTNEAYLIREYSEDVSEAQMIQDQMAAVAHSMQVK